MSPRPVIYSRASCAPCKTVKFWFAKNGVDFEERDIDKHKFLSEALNHTNGLSAVPVIVWKDEVVIGPNLSRLASLNSHA